MKLVMSLAFASGLLLAGPTLVRAAPFGELGKPIVDETMVTKVHGYHRSCCWGPHRGGWHRHLRSGRPIGCRRYYHGSSYPYYYGRPTSTSGLDTMGTTITAGTVGKRVT